MSNGLQQPEAHTGTHTHIRLIPESLAGKAAALGFTAALTLGTAACSHESSPETIIPSTTIETTVAPTESAEPSPTVTVAPTESAEPSPTAKAEVNDPAAVEAFLSKYETMAPEEFANQSIEVRIAYRYLKYTDALIEKGKAFYELTEDPRDLFPENLNKDSSPQDVFSAFKVESLLAPSIINEDHSAVDAAEAKRFFASTQLVPGESKEYAIMAKNLDYYESQKDYKTTVGQAFSDALSWEGFSWVEGETQLVNAPGDGLDKEVTYVPFEVTTSDGQTGQSAQYWIEDFTVDGLQIPGSWVVQH